MEPSAPIEFKSDLAIWSFLTFVVFVGAVVGVFFALRRSSQGVQVLSKILAVFAAIILAIAVFAGVFWSRTGVDSGSVQWQWTEQAIETHAASRRQETALSSESAKPMIAEALPDSPPAELPEWARQPSRVDGAKTFVVVKSGRFASLEEAELHAFDEAGQVAARHYRHFDPSGIGRCAPIQRELVRQQAIRDRFEEISRHDFGAMKNYPMHQVWLRVELSPQLGERFAEPWRKAVVESRLRKLTGWSIWGIAAAALVAFALRLDSAWNGRRRAILVSTTVVLAIGSLAFVA